MAEHNLVVVGRPSDGLLRKAVIFLNTRKHVEKVEAIQREIDRRKLARAA